MKDGGQILWNVKSICETLQIYYLIGRRPMKDVFNNHLRDLLFHLVHCWVSPYNCERSVKNPSIWKESLTWIVPRIRSVRGGKFGRVTYWSQTLRSWKRWTHRKSTRKDSMRKKWYFPNKENFFPIADGRIKTLRGNQELRTSTLVRHRPIQGDSNIDFLGKSKGSLPQPQDSFPDAREAINDFGSMSGSFIYRHHVEPRVKLYSPKKESFPIQLKYIDVTQFTHTNLDVKLEKRIDYYWNIDFSRDLSDPWTGLTQLLYWKKKLLTDILGPGGD